MQSYSSGAINKQGIYANPLKIVPFHETLIPTVLLQVIRFFPSRTPTSLPSPQILPFNASGSSSTRPSYIQDWVVGCKVLGIMEASVFMRNRFLHATVRSVSVPCIFLEKKLCNAYSSTTVLQQCFSLFWKARSIIRHALYDIQREYSINIVEHYLP